MQYSSQSPQPPGYPPPAPSVGNQPLPAYPPPPPAGFAPPPGYPVAYGGAVPIASRRVPWWGQLLALVIPAVIAVFGGSPIWFLLLWGTYGDSTPPPHADQAAAWLTVSYFSVAVLVGLGVHAIVIRKPWFFLAGLAVTAVAIAGMVWNYADLWTNVR